VRVRGGDGDGQAALRRAEVDDHAVLVTRELRRRGIERHFSARVSDAEAQTLVEVLGRLKAAELD
jgi:hypothetical protein